MLFNSFSNSQNLDVSTIPPKAILCLEGGGTLASVPSPCGKRPTLSLRKVFQRALPDYATLADLTFLESGPVLGELLASPNLIPAHYGAFAQAIFSGLKDDRAEGILLTLGTDTLAFVAAALSEIFLTLNKPVILTGAQRSIEHERTDVSQNLRVALLAMRFLPPGIYVAFGGVIIEGAVASKISSERAAGFVAVNTEPVAIFDSGYKFLRGNTLIKRELKCPESIDTRFDSHIRIETLFPGYGPEVLDTALRSEKTHGVVLRAYGLGNVPFKGEGSILPVLKYWAERKPIVDTTICIDGGTDLSIYEAGRSALEAGVLEAGKLTFELATVRLMRLLATTRSLEELKAAWHLVVKRAS